MTQEKPKVSITPEERAEKIYGLFGGDCRHSVESACDCRQAIAAEILAAEEAAREDETKKIFAECRVGGKMAHPQLPCNEGSRRDTDPRGIPLMKAEDVADMVLSLVDVDKKLLKRGVYEAVVLEIRDATNILLPIDRTSILGEELLNRAKAEAYEDAAKIAETGPGPGAIVEVDGDVRDPGAVATGYQKWIARKIRARKDEIVGNKFPPESK
jgi:hypothetical protein